jgi:quercetin dioxygenase-like cupin family protein
MPAGCGLAVLHGDPAKANADVFLKVPGSALLPDHWHTSAERMVLVAGELHVTYKGQATIVLKPGTYAYGPARLPHSASCVGNVPCILFIAFESAVDAVPTEHAK